MLFTCFSWADLHSSGSSSLLSPVRTPMTGSVATSLSVRIMLRRRRYARRDARRGTLASASRLRRRSALGFAAASLGPAPRRSLLSSPPRTHRSGSRLRTLTRSVSPQGAMRIRRKNPDPHAWRLPVGREDAKAPGDDRRVSSRLRTMSLHSVASLLHSLRPAASGMGPVGSVVPTNVLGVAPFVRLETSFTPPRSRLCVLLRPPCVSRWVRLRFVASLAADERRSDPRTTSPARLHSPAGVLVALRA